MAMAPSSRTFSQQSLCPSGELPQKIPQIREPSERTYPSQASSSTALSTEAGSTRHDPLNISCCTLRDGCGLRRLHHRFLESCSAGLRSNVGIPNAERSISRHGRSSNCLSLSLCSRHAIATEENMRKKQKSKISAHLGESFTKPGPWLLCAGVLFVLLLWVLFSACGSQDHLLAGPLPLRHEEVGQGHGMAKCLRGYMRA